MTTSDMAIRLTTAALLGGLVGLERRRADKAAGLRTHMLVSLGSCLFMIVSAHGFDDVLRPSLVRLDPSRVASQVVSGVGFLGAGAILRRKDSILGLTTAASIWAVAAIGLASGGGMHATAITATVVVLTTLCGMKWVEDRIAVRSGVRTVTLLAADGESAGRLAQAFPRPGLETRCVRFSPGDRPGSRRLDVTLSGFSDHELLTLIAGLQSDPAVLEVSIQGRTT